MAREIPILGGVSFRLKGKRLKLEMRQEKECIQFRSNNPFTPGKYEGSENEVTKSVILWTGITQSKRRKPQEAAERPGLLCVHHNSNAPEEKKERNSNS